MRKAWTPERSLQRSKKCTTQMSPPSWYLKPLTLFWEQVIEWQSLLLSEVYLIVYLDCIVVKIRQDKQVINKPVYLALGVNMEGHKERLGMWLSESEGTKLGLNVLSEL